MDVGHRDGPNRPRRIAEDTTERATRGAAREAPLQGARSLLVLGDHTKRHQSATLATAGTDRSLLGMCGATVPAQPEHCRLCGLVLLVTADEPIKENRPLAPICRVLSPPHSAAALYRLPTVRS